MLESVCVCVCGNECGERECEYVGRGGGGMSV